jgi:hypothetical protein
VSNSIFKDYKNYHWVLKLHRYENLESLILALEREVIAPAEAKARELAERKNEPSE